MPDLIDYAGTHIPQIAGFLIMAAVGAYLTEFNSRRSRLAVAAEKFRNAIALELKGLYPIPSKWPKDSNMINYQLRQAFPNIQIAVTNFRPFIPWYWRWAFDRAWFIYRLSKNGREIDKEQYDQYVSYSSNPNYKENFKHNVDKLLSFAKQI